MSGSFEFVQADVAERELFSDRERILSHPCELAAPRNRARTVVRLAAGGRVYYFKQFGPTSLHNRIRFGTSRPHGADDAERECLMTMALRKRGIEAPRPVLRGRTQDGSSFYLCERLPGLPLSEWLATRAHEPAMLKHCAAFCGELLATGFLLPDLSADHVFVRLDAGGWRFGVIDLHNGSLRRSGPAPLRTCRRALRRFLRSVESLPLARGKALRFALVLLRHAGRARHARAILRGLPPMDTAARYEKPGKAQAYKERNRVRAERELNLLATVWPGTPGESVLDAPCGTGRLTQFLSTKGHSVLRADGALAMLRQANDAAGPAAAAQAHALALPLCDGAVDGVVQFRFLHHLPHSAQKAAIAEACRVARRFVVASFFHPCSAHHAMRTLADLLTGAAPTRHAVTLGRVRRWFEQHGYALCACRAELPYCKDLWVASFVRKGTAN